MATLQKSMSVDSGSAVLSSAQKSESAGTERRLSRTHNYIPYIPRRESMVIRDRVAGVSEVNRDCRHIYPYIRLDGSSTMVTEYDFHVKMQKKYKALLGDKYVYPLLDVIPRVAEEDLLDITKDDKQILEYFIPHEVEVMVPGGIDTFKKDAMGNLYLFAVKDNRMLAVKTKTVMSKEMKDFQGKQEAMASGSHFCVPTNTSEITDDDVIEHLIAGMEVPDVRRLKNVFGFAENADEIIDKLRRMGLLAKYESKLDDEAYFRNFIDNRSRVFDVGCDFRRLREEERIFGPNILDRADSVEEKPSDTSFESEVDIEPFKIEGKSTFVIAPSCDSGLGLESPPMSPSSNSKSPTPCN